MFRFPTFVAFMAVTVAASTLHRREGGLTGDSQCGNDLCISAVVNGSTVEYVLTYSYPQKLGWLAMGFGTQMSNAQMVIMWPNSDGSVTLSQRKSPGEIMPTVDPSPVRTASFSTAISNIAAAQPQFGYTIPSNTDTKQDIIWSYAIVPPSGSAVDAILQQHVNMGSLSLDLTKPISSSTSGSPTTVPTGSTHTHFTPLLPYQKMVLAHSILVSLGFLVFLPSGVLLARYFRTRTSTWFTGHWIIQFALSAPLIVIGSILGFTANHLSSGTNPLDKHKKLGIVLLSLYLFQVLLGATIHFVKPKIALRRPVQNYTHAVLGLGIIGLAFYQVRLGYTVEWPEYVGRPVPKGVDVVWYIWVVLIPVVYFAGLVFIKKQYRLEKESRARASEKM